MQIQASDRLASAIANEKDAFDALAEAIQKVADAAAALPGSDLAIPTMNPVTGAVTTLIPVIPKVPVPSADTSPLIPGGGVTITINTGIGTNGVEAGRQIVEVIQQYSKIAADPLGINARQ